MLLSRVDSSCTYTKQLKYKHSSPIANMIFKLSNLNVFSLFLVYLGCVVSSLPVNL